MDLVSHVAKEHIEEEELNEQFQSTPKSDTESKESNFVFGESRLDEYIWVRPGRRLRGQKGVPQTWNKL